MEKIFDAKGDIIASGMHPGVANSQIPLWAQGNNFIFKDKSAKVAPAQQVLFNKLSGLRGLGILAIDNDGEAAAVWGNQIDLYKGTDRPTSVLVTRAGVQLFAGFEAGEAATWTGAGATAADDPVEFNEGIGSIKVTAGASATVNTIHKDPGSTLNLARRIITFEVFTEAAFHANMATGGDAISFIIGSTAGLSDDFLTYDIPHTDFPTANTWYTVTVDLSLAASSETGTPLIGSIVSWGLNFSQAVDNSTDTVNFDNLIITGKYAGTDTDKWSIVQFGQTILATNGVDPVQYLASITSGLFVDIDSVSDLATTFRCEVLQKLGPYVIAFNTNQDNTEARWSTEDDVTVWLPFASNSARDINLRDMNSDIVAVIEFGNSLFVVGKNRAHIFQFIGPPFFFGAQKLLDGIGALGKGSLVQVGRLVYGMGPSGLFVTDGSSHEYIDDPDIHKFIYEDPVQKLDKELGKLQATWHDIKEDVIYFSYPTIDGKGFTVGYQPDDKLFSMHDYWRTAASAGELWEGPLLMDPAGDVWLQGEIDAAQVSNPLGISDICEVRTAYGESGYGQNGYGGRMVVT